MGAVITKQPNGKYARFSSVVDTFTDWNLTKDELKELMTRKFGAEDYDVTHFEDFLAGKHSYRPYDFYKVIQDMSLSNETLESARKKLSEMGFRGAENWQPSVCWDDDRKKQAKWIIKEISKYMYRFGFDLIVKDGDIYLKDKLFFEEDGEVDDTGFGEVKFVFDDKNCEEPFYGTDENLYSSKS